MPSQNVESSYGPNYKPFFKNTLRQQLVRPKDLVPKERVMGPIYHMFCEDCGNDYIGGDRKIV